MSDVYEKIDLKIIEAYRLAEAARQAVFAAIEADDDEAFDVAYIEWEDSRRIAKTLDDLTRNFEHG
jgi:hypothetical protein